MLFSGSANDGYFSIQFYQLTFDLSSQQASKVTVLGAAGGIGQPLSLLMKLNPRVSHLALYDIRGGPGKFGLFNGGRFTIASSLLVIAGVAADLSHINTHSVVTGHEPTPSGLKEALSGADIVLIPAGVPRKPGMTRDGMIERNLPISESVLF